VKLLATAAICCGLAVSVPALRADAAANHTADTGETPGAEEHGKMLGWMWANFCVLAAGLGYLIYQNAGAFYAARSRKIRRDLIEAGDLKKEAEERAAEVERRLANLEAEIQALRAESQREAAAETERLSAQTKAELAKIQAHAEREIEAAGRMAYLELRRYSASLAVGLAARKIQSRISPETQASLVANFVQKLDGSVSAGQSN
jgi:F-type H+-transporting ATPase subunit b